MTSYYVTFDPMAYDHHTGEYADPDYSDFDNLEEAIDEAMRLIDDPDAQDWEVTLGMWIPDDPEDPEYGGEGKEFARWSSPQ